MINYTYNAKARQYVGPSGRFVPRADIRSALDAVIDVAQGELRATALRLQSGEIDLNSWYYASAAQIKRIIVASGTLAVGGPHGLTPSVLGTIGAAHKAQIKYLHDFARELEDGYPLDGTFLSRVAMYGESGRATYEAIVRAGDIKAGYRWERRLLGGDNPCDQCRDEFDKGWQRIGTLKPLGGCTCLTRCRCSRESSKSKTKPTGVAAMSTNLPLDADAPAEWEAFLSASRIVGFKGGGKSSKGGKASGGSSSGRKKLSGGSWVTIAGHPVYIKGGKVVAGGVPGVTHSAKGRKPAAKSVAIDKADVPLARAFVKKQRAAARIRKNAPGKDTSKVDHAAMAARIKESAASRAKSDGDSKPYDWRYEHGGPKTAADREHLRRAEAKGGSAVKVTETPKVDVERGRNSTGYMLGGRSVARVTHAKAAPSDDGTGGYKVGTSSGELSSVEYHRTLKQAHGAARKHAARLARDETTVRRLVVGKRADLDPALEAAKDGNTTTTFRTIHGGRGGAVGFIVDGIAGWGRAVAMFAAKAAGKASAKAKGKSSGGKKELTGGHWVTIQGSPRYIKGGEIIAGGGIGRPGSKSGKPEKSKRADNPDRSTGKGKDKAGKIAKARGIKAARPSEPSARSSLAADLRSARRSIKDQDDRDTFNRHARLLRQHRRGETGAISDDHASVIRDRLKAHGEAERSGKPLARPSVREQAESARIAKPSPADRAKAIRDRLKGRAADKGKAADSRDPSTHGDHAPGHVGDLDTKLINADPERFQYKAGYGEGGSVGSLAGVRKYDKDLAGVIQVWKDPADSKTYVINGHNRLDLAKKLGADKVTVRYIEAKDAGEARSKGALTNIAEGRGTAIDAAKYFRDTGLTREQIAERGIPMREKVATDGLALSRLEPNAFKRVVSGEMTAARGAIIGGSGLKDHEQAALVKMLDKHKGREITDSHLKELADEVKSARSVRSEGNDLFGSTADDHSLAIHKTKLQATIKDRLSKEKRLFGIVAKSKHADELARAGNSINTGESAKVSENAAVTLGVFDRMKNLSGPVSRSLNDAAERIYSGENARKVTDETYRKILKDLPAMLAGGNEFAA